ncbi:PD-(D/E)XK nuclease-like domain-containing protein [Plantibacter sp. YIM 135249]|uniref:PD-(D/E)XK nuclease-like domain-containing protein n=1 Tax=Plantibacter sp. YIM 135249 TaxID=3423918 RepID=UPI003D33DC2F
MGEERPSGIVYGLDEAAYHAHPALSSTNARRLLDSPARYKYLQTHPEPPKTVFDVGTAAHSKVLGTGAPIDIIPAKLLASNGAISTTAAKEFIAKSRAAGRVPVKADVAEEVNSMAEAVLAHPSARVLLEQEGHSEVSMFGTDPDTELDVRARFDFAPSGGRTPVAWDLKSARDASPRGFAKAVAEHGYHIQRGHYMDTNEFAGGIDLDGFAFVVVESKAPYLVGAYRLNSDWEDIGVAQAREARTILRRCLDTDTWPGYDDNIQSLIAPFWLIADYQESL